MTFLLITTAAGSHISYKDCGSKSGRPIFVDLDPCPTERPCVLHVNTQVQLAVRFFSSTQTDQVTTVITGYLAGVDVPLPISDPNSCDHGVNCPVSSGQVNTYNESIYVDPGFPLVEMTMRVELKDDGTDDLACVEYPIKI
uniref:MD-2-related lipid-recognition domain-containing protein n=1 Tax=Capitella teleta TaxID=283909 RepID=X2B3M1_CAPTE